METTSLSEYPSQSFQLFYFCVNTVFLMSHLLYPDLQFKTLHGDFPQIRDYFDRGTTVMNFKSEKCVFLSHKTLHFFIGKDSLFIYLIPSLHNFSLTWTRCITIFVHEKYTFSFP